MNIKVEGGHEKADVAVVIPTHERPELLKRSMMSVLNQTLLPSEIIVADDTGSLLTQDVVETFSQDYPSVDIIFLSNSSSGASSSRNLGAQFARSSYVAFLDDDDIWLPNKLEEQMSMLEKQNLDAVFSQLIVRYEGLGIEYVTKTSNVENPLKSICTENYLGATISCLVCKRLFLELGGFDVSFQAREEYDLWIRIICFNAKIGVVEKPLAISHRSFERKRISSELVRYEQGVDLLNRKHRDLVDRCLTKKERSQRSSKQFDFLAAQAVSIGKRLGSAKYYYSSFITTPKFRTLVLMLLSVSSPLFLIKLRSRM
ncbi:glycosyltransferase family A protein [Vibrio sp. Vb2131]|uniref:glycosyltransferase family 2 protein n=1 Tax=Vibrio sp. Vb2131 TaxID=3074649 RepID=UPI0029648ACC|nr:glycosyltransferase family A protein [Vibrio sp. Vb2131]MDW1886838.1 glycosyltransferase family A protein [Vibrio sp. Vb2131]